MKTGMGRDGFIWFEGVIEDRMDPLGIGRMRVRAYGFDNASREEVPTEHLPWAYPMLPLNSAQGEVHSPKEGTWVLGFFRDGADAQDRVILGTINTGAYTSVQLPSHTSSTTQEGLEGGGTYSQRAAGPGGAQRGRGENLCNAGPVGAILSDIAAQLGHLIKGAGLGADKITEHFQHGGYTSNHVSRAHREDRAIDVGTGTSWGGDPNVTDPYTRQKPMVDFLNDYARKNDIQLKIFWVENEPKNHWHHLHVEVLAAPTIVAQRLDTSSTEGLA